mgnify:CR=1 FL=1
MRGGQDAGRSLMAGGMSAEAAAIAREAQMRSEASEAARIAYVTQARTLRERCGSFIKMVVVSALVAAICSRLRGTVGALGFSISTGLVIWGVVDGARQARDGHDARPRRCRQDRRRGTRTVTTPDSMGRSKDGTGYAERR